MDAMQRDDVLSVVGNIVLSLLERGGMEACKASRAGWVMSLRGFGPGHEPHDQRRTTSTGPRQACWLVNGRELAGVCCVWLATLAGHPQRVDGWARGNADVVRSIRVS